MRSRFKPRWREAERALEQLVRDVRVSEDRLIQAFTRIPDVSHTAKSIDDIRNHLRFVFTTSDQTPWLFYDLISTLNQGLIPASAEAIAEKLFVRTEHDRYEHLKVTPDGNWRVEWELDPHADRDERNVSLVWYQAFDHDAAPVTPLPLIDYVAGAVSLIRKNLVLPAAALVSIALESAVWDALTAVGIDGYSEQISYKPVTWSAKTKHDRLLITVVGADKDLRNLPNALGQEEPEVQFALRRMQSKENAEQVNLQLEVISPLVSFLATEEIEKRERRPDRTLTSGIQRGRATGVKALRIFPDYIEGTLVAVRNNLVHLPTRGPLHQPIPAPDTPGIQTLDELRERQDLVAHLLHWVIDLINIVYTSDNEKELVQQDN